jgi:hypothetical protein
MAQNELVFECKRTQIKPNKGGQEATFYAPRSGIREWRDAGGWASARGGYISFEFDVSRIRNREIMPDLSEHTLFGFND